MIAAADKSVRLYNLPNRLASTSADALCVRFPDLGTVTLLSLSLWSGDDITTTDDVVAVVDVVMSIALLVGSVAPSASGHHHPDADPSNPVHRAIRGQGTGHRVTACCRRQRCMRDCNLFAILI